MSERKILLAAADMLIVLVIGCGLSWENAGPGGSPGLAMLFAVLWVVFAQFSGLYNLETASRGRRLLRALAAAASMYCVSLLIFYFAAIAHTWPTHHAPTSRLNFLVLMAAPSAIALWRYVYIRFLGNALPAGSVR